jgi:hypothetical protein
LQHTPAAARTGTDRDCDRNQISAGAPLPTHRRFRNFGGFVLAKYFSGGRIDQVNTSADGARHDLINFICGLNAGVAFHAKARIGAAV